MYLRIVSGIVALLSLSAFARSKPVEAPVPARAGVHASAPTAQAMVPGGPPSALLGTPPADGGNWSFGDAAAPAFEFTAASSDATARAIDCLTAAIYYEARSEPVDGQRAVAQVVLNRVRNPAFPSNVCGVVYQGAERTTGCQFTFTCDGSMLAPRDPVAWARSRQLALQALAGNVYAPVGGATYFHTTAVSPWWAPSLARIGQIGTQIFYRLQDAWAQRLNFHQSYSGVEPLDVASASAAAPGGDQALRDGTDYVSAEGGTIGIHRGATLAHAGVTIHRGGETAAAAAAPDAPAQIADDAPAMGQVRVHLGSARPGEGAAPKLGYDDKG